MAGRKLWIPGFLALAALALGAYFPALGGDFLWDDTDWIADNEVLRSWHGLWRIWFEPSAVIQYYPLTYTSWWLDQQLWGLSPTVMHVENVLLHAGNALLFGALLRRLRLPGAMAAALIFLLHPVHVESVAWLVERKNTLSTAFFLGACHLWLSHLEAPSRRALLGSLGLFVGALLAKTATLMLPVVLLGLAIWRRREWRSALRSVAPFVLLSLLAAAVTIAMERGLGAVGYDWDLSWPERLVLVGQTAGFYLGKLAWPVPLSFVYPKWSLAADSLLGWAPSVALLGALLATLRARRAAALAAGFALWVFVANLLPVSGLVDFYYLRYAFVADHFQYLPSLGPIALAGCGGAILLRPAHRRTGPLLLLTVAVTLATATWSRAFVFRDVETLWRRTLATEPDAWLAHANLGNLLAKREGPDAGIEHHRTAVAIYRYAFESNNALGNHFARRGDFTEARAHFDLALAARPEDPLTFNNLGAMAGLQGDLRAALFWFERGHRLAPHNRDLLRNLVMLLAQAPDPALRDGPRALRLARQLNDVVEPELWDRYALFRALLLTGDRGEAIALGRQVLRRAADEGQAKLAALVDAQLSRLTR